VLQSQRSKQQISDFIFNVCPPRPAASHQSDHFQQAHYEINVLWVVLVWDAACRRVTTSDALIANDPTSQFGGIWLETGEQATSPTPKHTNESLMKF
jgi:hypothetical protein